MQENAPFMQRLVKLTNKKALNRYIFAAKKQDIVPRLPKRRLFVKKMLFFAFCPIFENFVRLFIVFMKKIMYLCSVF